MCVCVHAAVCNHSEAVICNTSEFSTPISDSSHRKETHFKTYFAQFQCIVFFLTVFVFGSEALHFTAPLIKELFIGLLSPRLSLFVSLSCYSLSGVSIFMSLHFIVITSLRYFIIQVVSRLSLSVCSKAEYQSDSSVQRQILKSGLQGSEAD